MIRSKKGVVCESICVSFGVFSVCKMKEKEGKRAEVLFFVATSLHVIFVSAVHRAMRLHGPSR
jgi:hypothetical protein